jgi:hypothetical protein
MTRLLLLLAASAAFAADNPWDKVKELKSGAEIRIVRRGVAQPIEAKLDEVRDDAVVVVVKNEQKAIPKDEIDRLDARPKVGSRVTRESKSTTEAPDTKPAAGMDHGPQVPGQSYSSGLSVGSKPGYETVYRRLSPGPASAPPAKQ